MDLHRAEAILEAAHSAFVSMDQGGRIAYWNARAEEMFGLRRDEAIGRTVAEAIVPERYREAHWSGIQRFLESGEGPMLNRRVELAALRADGSEFPIELTISALREDDGWSFHAFIGDISDRRQAESERDRLLQEVQRALHGSEQRLAVVMDSLAEAVTIRAPDDRVIFANHAALKRLGLSSLEQLRETDPRVLMGPWDIRDEHGREVAMEQLPSVRLLRGEQPEPMLLRYVNRASGEEQWTLLKASAVREPGGQIEAAITIIEDVTEQRRAHLRMEFLVRASHVLASSLDQEETLRNVAGLAVPHIADWCALDLLDEDGDHHSVAVAHIDPEKLRLAERARELGPSELDPSQGLGRVLATGEPEVYLEIPDELLVQAALSEEHLALLREVGMRSALIVPMTARGRTIGALTLVNADSQRTFDDSDVAFAQQIAQGAALAVENARLYSERSTVARTLQRSLLPDALPEVPGWQVAAFYRPAGQGNEVGGDFYDVWETGDSWLMIIGDVTGKGIAAAAVTSLVRHTAWAAADHDPSPAHVLARVDHALKRRPTLSICSALCIRIAGAEITIASGGHPLPLHLSPGGVHEIGCHGTLLGAFPNPDWPETGCALDIGETLVGITDGVTDTVGGDGERFGTERLREMLAALASEHPVTLRGQLTAALEEFQVGAQADDTAMVIMRFCGPQAEQDEPVQQTQGIGELDTGTGDMHHGEAIVV